MVNNMDDFFGNFGTEEPQRQRDVLPGVRRPQEQDSFFGTFGQQPTRTERVEEEPEGEIPEGFTGQFLTGSNYRTVRDYMETNFGMTEEDYTREDIVNSYVTNMRRFAAGQSVVTVSELSKLYQAGDNLSKYTDAYRLWDEASGVFSDESDATVGEQARGVYDYARAAIVDPVNLFTFGFGKLAGIAGGRAVSAGGQRLAARDIAQRAIRESIEQAGGEAARTAARRRGVDALEEVVSRQLNARETAVRGLMESTAPQAMAYQQALRNGYRAEILGGAAMETVASGALDVAYQDAMITANVQEDFDPTQFLISTFVPAAFGGAALALSRGSTDVTRILRQESVNIARERSYENHLRYLSQLKEEGAAKVASMDEVNSGVQQAAKQAQDQFSTWMQKVQAGTELAQGAKQADVEDVMETQALNYFLNGERTLGVEGILSQFYKNVDPDLAKRLLDDSINHTDFVTSAMTKLNRDAQLQLIDLFNSTVGVVNPKLRTNSIEDVSNYVASQASQAGRQLQVFSASKKDFSRILEMKFDKEDWFKQMSLDILVKGEADEVPDAATTRPLIERMQNNYVRMLVTHPGTTMLNLTGWVQMSGINTVANTLRGTIYGGLGLIEGLAKGDMKASVYAHKAAMEFGSLKQQLSNLVNPYATYDEAMAYLLQRPNARKELFKYIAGGVESGIDEQAILKQAGLEGADPTSANFFEKYMQATQVLYGVRAVDFLSKTQEFMTNLDRQIRRKYGQSYQEFMLRDDFYEIITSRNKKTFKDFLEVEQRAVNDTLRATFNKSFASDEGIGVAAKLIEDIRKVPIIGALAPFGQFFNNTMALTADLSGLTAVHHLYLRGANKKAAAKIDRDMTEMLIKAGMGWGIIGIYANKEYENLEQGLPWYAERQADGALVDRRYDFPLAAFKGYGRIAAHMLRDGSVPTDLVKEVSELVGPGSFSRQLNDSVGSVWAGIEDVLVDPSNEFFPTVINILETSMSQYASGVTRSLDPLNQIVALSRGEDYEALDRSIGNRNINNAIRYVDQFFVPLMDPERQPPVSATTGREPAAQTNRIFGYRELPAPSTIERMFADIGRPNWKTEIRVPDPQAGRIMREHIFPHLEYEAAQLLESPLWERSSLEQREIAVRRVITGARSRMMESLRNSYNEPDRKAALIYDIFNSSLRARARDSLIESMGVEPDTLWTLTEDQLETLLFAIKREGSVEREVGGEIREGRYR
jgi:hypothetical protein